MLKERGIEYVRRVAFRYLSSDEWVIYVFNFILGYSMKQVASALGVKYSTAARQKKRVEEVLKIYGKMYNLLPYQGVIATFLEKNCSKRELYILRSIKKRSRKERMVLRLGCSYSALGSITSRLFCRLKRKANKAYIKKFLNLLQCLSKRAQKR